MLRMARRGSRGSCHRWENPMGWAWECGLAAVLAVVVLLVLAGWSSFAVAGTWTAAATLHSRRAGSTAGILSR